MQRHSSVLAGVLVVGLFAGPSARPAQASDFDKLTYVTFSGPVEIPGVALPAGTYIFKLADPGTGNRVVQVLSKDGKTVYAMSFSLPETRPAPADETIVTFHKGERQPDHLWPSRLGSTPVRRPDSSSSIRESKR